MYRLLIALIISLVVLSFLTKDQNQNFDELAFGIETTGSNAKGENNDLIHIEKLNDFEELYSDWISRGKNEIILLLGNSQYHTINQMKKGDVVLSQILYDYYKKDDIDFITNSLPNVNLQEQYLIFEYFSRRLPIKLLILPVFMDDTREDDIRFGLPEYLKKNVNYSQNNSVIHKLFSTEIQQTQDDIAGLKETFQEKVEYSINQYLNKHSQKWSRRGSLRSELFIKLYRFRNSLFGITPSSKRKKITGPYKNNIYAYKLILGHCQSLGINALIYIPPIRNDVEIPYDKKEYIDFKNKIKNIAKMNDAYFLDFENIIPQEYWGSKASTAIDNDLETDFMHFQFKGHKILADTLLMHINSDILLR